MGESLARRRICFIAGTLGQGGAERQLYGILSALKARGADVSLITLTRGEFWQSRIEALGVPVLVVGGSGSRLRRVIQIARHVRRLRPDIVQAQHFFVNLYAALAARWAGARSIGGIRNNVHSEVADLGRLLGGASLRWPDMLAANSRAAVAALQALGLPDGRVHFLPNVVLRGGQNSGVSRTAGAFRIVGVGRLERQKRFDLFLEVVSRLARRFPIEARILGEGTLRHELESLALSKGLRAPVLEFVGRVPDPSPYYRDADCLLMSSDFEGTPNVVLEAMAHGLPVVSTKAGEVPYLLGNGERGIGVETGDVDGMEAALERLWKDWEWGKALGVAGREFVEREHSQSALERSLELLYTRVLES